MDALKQWIICIIFCSLVAAVVTVLSPKNSTQRVLKTVSASFLICAFLSPFIGVEGINADFEIPDFSQYKNDLSDEITEKMITEAETQTRIKTEELLETRSVGFNEIGVRASVNSENCIYIELITITLPEKFDYREKQISSNLKTMFSSEVEFIWENE